jgi:hypothetical protein
VYLRGPSSQLRASSPTSSGNHYFCHFPLTSCGRFTAPLKASRIYDISKLIHTRSAASLLFLSISQSPPPSFLSLQRVSEAHPFHLTRPQEGDCPLRRIRIERSLALAQLAAPLFQSLHPVSHLISGLVLE